MSTPEFIFYIIYNLVALFYLICGVLVLLYPKQIENHLETLFPLLISFKYNQIVNSLNLILIGAFLIIVGKLISLHHLAGIYFALILSAFEIYLGVKFYYMEKKDLTQANIHVIVHVILCVILIKMSALFFIDEIVAVKNGIASVIGSLWFWSTF